MPARKLLAFACAVAFAAPVHGAPAATGLIRRGTEPVVLTGAQFPLWSAGPDVTAHEPQVPTNGSVPDTQQYLPAGLQSECYKKSEHPNEYDYADSGDHSCYQSSRLPNNPNVGADVKRILGFRWDGSKFAQIPFQVDEKFTRYLTNNVSGFAFYSGVDQETTYAWDREGFRYTSDDYLLGLNDKNPCVAEPAPGSTIIDGKATTADPVKGLDDNDELAFMYDDAGDAAPPGTALPAGMASAYEIAVSDPSNGRVSFVYPMLAKAESAGGPSQASIAQWNADHSYVRYERDANANQFAYSISGSGGYGTAQKGPYCNADGSISTTYHRSGDKPAHGRTIDGADPKPWAIEQRRPLDTAWVKTPRYWFRYEGRWLMTALRISPDNSGLSANPNLGPDIVDQWKARAFQQRPGDPNDPAAGHTPCCGYEEEVYNWGGSSILFGERTGPVRAIRAAWGADSSTNNVKTETFYRDEIRFADNLRVHVIPPFDGIYVQWDYNAGTVDKYYNPLRPDGVPIDGQNDEVFGNTKVHISNDRVQVTDPDPIPGTPDNNGDGKPDGIDVTVPGTGGDPNSCSLVCNDLDFADPTFSGPSGNLNWEEVAGPNGSLVTRWTIRQHSADDAESLIAQPYYRDDSCFDDGTGSNPGPHLNIRHADYGAYNTWTDPATGITQKRTCWKPGDVLTGDPALDARYVQGDIATHGLHLQLIADSDNAQTTVPLDEIDSEQRMVVLPGDQHNVGDAYGRGTVEFPMHVAARPYV
jgi:hypothetical protein